MKWTGLGEVIQHRSQGKTEAGNNAKVSRFLHAIRLGFCYVQSGLITGSARHGSAGR
jgi:hypothetical protein